MKQEDKQLLLKDLCARVVHGVKMYFDGNIFTLEYVNNFGEVKLDNDTKGTLNFEDYPQLKPYLRPMLSMTEEEKEEQSKIALQSMSCSLDNSESATTMLNDWLLSKHFDVRGLISKGLALEAPDEMYKTK